VKIRFLNSESYKRGILSSITLNVFSKCLAFVNSMMIAYYFGTQSQTDIYIYCYATVGLIIGFLGSLDASIIIPESMRIREQENAEKAQYFINYFLYLYIGIGLLVMFILLIDPVRVLSTISKFDIATLEENEQLVMWFVPICMLMLVTQYLTNILSSFKYFTSPIIAAIINSFFSILFLIFFHRSLAVKSIIAGLTVGYIFNISMLLFILKKQLNWHFSFRRIEFHPGLWRNVRYALLGNVATLVSGYTPFYIMSNFNPGTVTMFNYAKSLSEIPSQMVTTQFSAVAGIKFNELSARKNLQDLNALFTETTNFLIFLMMPVFALFFLFSDEIVAIFYQRGAFGEAAVKQTAYLLKFLGFSVIFLAVNTMVSRLFMATQKLKEAIKFQIYMNGFFIALLFIASWQYGITGFAAGTLLYQIIVIAGTYLLLRKHFSFIAYIDVLRNIGFNLLLNGFLVVVFYVILRNYEKNSFLFIAISSIIYFFLIILANRWLRIDKVSHRYSIQLVSKIRSVTSSMFSK